MENVPPNRCRSDSGLDGMGNQIEGIDCEGEEVVVAISPDGNLYYDYESIPCISRPRFLMLKEETIIADGWLIRISPTEEWMEFINRTCIDWKDWTKAGDIQLNGFLDALESMILAQFRSDGGDGLNGGKGSRLGI
jgi:hypothetical protein